MYDIEAFRLEASLLVAKSSEGAHPRPYNRNEVCRGAIPAPLGSSDNATSHQDSPTLSRKRMAPADVTTVFAPKSPSEEELDRPESERPPSWYAQDDQVGNRTPAPKVRRP